MNELGKYLRCLGTLATILSLAACGGGGGGGDEGGGTPTAPPPPPPPPATVTVSLGDDRIVDEGSNGGTTEVQFTVTLDSVAAGDVIVDYSTEHITTEDSDFTPTTDTLTIPAGSTEGTISVFATADTAFELSEIFGVRISNPSSNATVGDDEAIGQLLNDDPLTVTLDLWRLAPGDGALSGPALEIDYDMLIDLTDLFDDLGVAELLIPYDVYYESDIHLPFIVASGHLRIIVGGGTTGRLFVLLPPGFDSFAVDGRFLVEFDWSAIFPGVTDATWEFIAPIEPQDIADDTALLAVGDEVVLVEGDTGTSTTMTFTAELDEALATPVTLDYATLDGSAVAPADYEATVGSVTIPAGDVEAQFSITVTGDDEPEGTETFIVSLVADSDLVVLQAPWATGSIFDDDTVVDRRRIRILNSELIEGDSGLADMEFDVTLDAPATTPVTFQYSTRDDTAEGGVDYEETTDEATFQVGEDQLTISVPVIGDTEPEDDETFVVFVSGTFGNAVGAQAGVGKILSDDPLTRVSIADFALAEGASGTTTFGFTVSLTEALDEPLDIGYTTSDVTALAGEDYTAANSTISIPVGAVEGTIDVLVDGDTDLEDDEVFEVVITTTSDSAILARDTAEGTILNDDGAGGWAGAELVHLADSNPVVRGIAVWPHLAFGPGPERHVVYLQASAVWHRVSQGRDVWAPPVEIGSIASLDRTPRLVIDDGSNGIAVWPNGIVEAAVLDANGWTTAPLPMAIDVLREIALDGDFASGEAIMTWVEPPSAANNSVSSVWAARHVPGTGWQDLGLVETLDVVASNPEIAVNADEAMIIFQQAPAGGTITDVVAYRLAGSTWEGPTVIDIVDGEHPIGLRIDMNGAGQAAAVWYQEEPVTPGIPVRSIYMNHYDPNLQQWVGGELVEERRDVAARDPDVAIDGAGNVFVIWLQGSDDFRTENLMARRYDAAAGAWSDPLLLELDDTAPGSPIVSQQIVADDFGNAIAVWIQDDGVQQNVRAARYSSADEEWTPSELLEDIDTGDANGPDLVIDRATGDAMVVWHHADGSDINIWANRYTNR